MFTGFFIIWPAAVWIIKFRTIVVDGAALFAFSAPLRLGQLIAAIAAEEFITYLHNSSRLNNTEMP